MATNDDGPPPRGVGTIVRDYRWLVLGLLIAGALAGVGLSAAQKKTYSAQASIAAQDLTMDYASVGVAVAPDQSQPQIAYAAAQTTTSQKVASAVKAMLHSPLTTNQLLDKVTANVDATSEYVIVQASAPTAQGAAALADAFATASVTDANQSSRSAFRAQAQELSNQITGLGKGAGTATERFELQQERAKLLSLGDFATSASVAKQAMVPTSPSSPKPAFNGILGGILGLVLAILIAAARSALDKRIRSRDEVATLLEPRVVGYLASSALGGAPEALGPSRAITDVDFDSVKIIRRNLDFLGSDTQVKSVAVTSAMPQEGKSTVAVALAYASAAIGRRTLLIECDLRRPVLADRLKLKHTPGIAEYLAGEATPQEIIQLAPVRPGDSPATETPLVILTAGRPSRRSDELLSTAAFRRLIEEVSDAYDMVVIDSPPVLAVADTLEVLPLVDSVLLCVRVRQTTRQQALSAQEAIAGLPERPTGVVITAVDRSADYADYAYGYQAAN